MMVAFTTSEWPARQQFGRALRLEQACDTVCIRFLPFKATRSVELVKRPCPVPTRNPLKSAFPRISRDSTRTNH